MRQIADLKDMLDGSAELYGKLPAFHVKDERGGKYKPITYRQLKRDVDCLGTKLIDMGLRGEKIAVVGENCYQWVVTYLAVTNGVGIIVPLDKEIGKEEMLVQIANAGCAGVFYTENFAKYFADAKIRYKVDLSPESDSSLFNYEVQSHLVEDAVSFEKLLKVGAACLEAGDRRFIDAVIDPTAFSILLFTSGTTEASKGVMLSHQNIASTVMAAARVVNLSPSDRLLSILPIHHTFECSAGIMTPLYAGSSIAFCEGLKYIAKNIVEIKATVVIGVPLIFETLYKKIWKSVEKEGKSGTVRKAAAVNRKLKSINGNFDVSKKLFKEIHEKFGGKLSTVVSGAAAIDPNVCRGFEDLGFKFIQGYGLTECAPLVAATPYYVDTYKKAGSIGLPCHMVEVKIVDQTEDGIGEIICRGPNVMLGYYNDPERTAAVLKDGWFYTGDLGFIDKEGFVYITGRQKNVIVTKTGKNIYPEELEFYINDSKYVEESFVYGTYSDREEDTIVAITVRPDYENIYEEFGKGISDEKVSELIKNVVDAYNEKGAVYKRIRKVTVRKDEFIKTTTKKIKRKDPANMEG